MAHARLICQGCGHEVAADEPLPFRCGAAVDGDGIDHLLRVVWDGEFGPLGLELDDNPFVAFRAHAYSHAKALEHGMGDGQYVEVVRALDRAIADVDGHGFRITPWHADESLGVWFKDETAGVAGSHKARHLFGLALWIEVAECTGLIEAGLLGSSERPLAIASCGNAAIAAAVIARAWGRELHVFIPTWADAAVALKLRELGAEVVTCEREAGAALGDPCFHAFCAAVAAGAVPFTCQGPENGLVIDGGKTLGFEIAREIVEERAPALDHLFIQIGGGALASATCQALALALGETQRMPAIHAVQTVGCQPIATAWRRLASELCTVDAAQFDDAALARWLVEHVEPETFAATFKDAARHRSRYMQPVVSPPASVASGILDDETYDWFVIACAMIRTGGWPVAVTEDDLLAARDAARSATGVNVDATGAAGFAGVQVARRTGQLKQAATTGVLFTGVQR